MADRIEWEFPFKKVLSIDTCPPPSSFSHKLETGVKNGDCLPGCFCALLESMHSGKIYSKSLLTPASDMRQQIIKWVKRNWESYTIFQPSMPVHELMWLQHDVGTPPQEREHREPWGTSPQSRLVAYSKVCDKIYFCDTEMMIFASMMYEKNLPLLFRVWRVTGPNQERGELVHTLPDKAFYTQSGLKDAVVIDIAHTGRVDQASAHYKLLSSASLRGLTGCSPKRERE